MRLFVTGGAGFIGSNYARWVLAHTDDDVVVYDALTYAGNRDNLQGLEDDPRLVFVQGDVCDRDGVADAMAGCDAVVHFAAESHVDRSIIGPDAFVRTNCDGTNVVCDTARLVGVEKVVQVSTDEVYGSVDEGSFAETDRLEPRSPYSASKAGADLIALAYRETFGLPVAVTPVVQQLRPPSAPGEADSAVHHQLAGRADGTAVWRRHERAGLVPCGGQLRGHRPGAAPGPAGRDLQHRRGQRADQPGADRSPAGAVRAGRVVHSAMWTTGWATIGAMRWTPPKIEELGWSPEREMDEALAATVDWYRGQPLVVDAAQRGRSMRAAGP